MNRVKRSPNRVITPLCVRCVSGRSIRTTIGPKSEFYKLRLSNTANKRNFNWPELTLNWTLEQC